MTRHTQSEWWRSLSKEAKRRYIEDHPNSKYAKQAKNNSRIKKVFSKDAPGSLHEYMGVEKGKKLPITKLRQVANSDHHLARRARMALSLQGYTLKRKNKKKYSYS